MTPNRKKSLLVFLEGEIKKARENAYKADEASKFIMTGPSQSGDKQSLPLRDKYHVEKAADLTHEYLQRLELLKKEIKAADETPKDTVEPVSLVEIEYDDKSRLQFILVKNAVSLAKHLFISTDSPLGRAILSKKVGDEFSYTLKQNDSQKRYSGRIVRVE